MGTNNTQAQAQTSPSQTSQAHQDYLDQQLDTQYTKLQLHEAFTTEHHARKALEETIKQLSLHNAGLRSEAEGLKRALETQSETLEFYDDLSVGFDNIQEAYLRLHIEKYVGITGDYDDVEDDLDSYFDRPHVTHWTANGGYICVTQEEDHDFIQYMWGNHEHARQEFKEMHAIINDLYDHSKITDRPLWFTGTVNVIQNHSVTLEPDTGSGALYQIRLDCHFDDRILAHRKLYAETRIAELQDLQEHQDLPEIRDRQRLDTDQDTDQDNTKDK